MMTAETMRVRLGLSADDGGMDAVIEQLLAQAEAYARMYCRLRDGEDVRLQVALRDEVGSVFILKERA